MICCDKAASTGGARVSRVEGHTGFRSFLHSRKGPRKGGYDIFVIMLPDTCPSVTTAPDNKLPADLFFHFMAARTHV